MKRNSVMHDSCLGLALAAVTPLVIGTDLVTAPKAEAAVLIAAAGGDLGFTSAGDPPDWWWEPLWGAPFGSDLIITTRPDIDEWGLAHLKLVEEDGEGEVSLVDLATVDLEKHYQFPIFQHSDQYELDFVIEPSGDMDGEFTEGVHFTGTFQYQTEYWGVSFHNEVGHEASAVISVTTFTLDYHGPAPEYDGVESMTLVFPMLEFESVEELFEFIDVDAIDAGGSAAGQCGDVPDHWPCYIDCPSLSACLLDARQTRDSTLAGCSFDLNYIIDGAWSGAGIGIAVMIPVGGAIGLLIGPGGVVIGSGAGALGGLIYGAQAGATVGALQALYNFSSAGGKLGGPIECVSASVCNCQRWSAMTFRRTQCRRPVHRLKSNRKARACYDVITRLVYADPKLA